MKPATVLERAEVPRKPFRGAEYLVCRATKDDVFTREDLTEEQRQIGAVTEQFVAQKVMPLHARIEGNTASACPRACSSRARSRSPA